MARPRADFVTVFAVLAVTAVVATAPGPLLVVIRDEFGLTFAQLGLIFSAQALAGMLTNIPAGMVADRLPARVPIAAGAAGLAAGTLLMALSPGYLILLAGNLIATVGATFMITSSIAYTVAQADPEQRGRATSRVMSGVQVGAFIGPALAGVVAAAFDWRAALILPAALCLCVAAVIPAIVRGGAPSRPERSPRMFSLGDLRLPRVVWPIIALAMLLTGPVVGQSRVILPLYAGEGLDFTPAVVGVAISAMSAARAVLTFLSGNLMDRAGRGSAFYAMVLGAFGAAVLLTLPLGLGVFIAAGALSAVTGLGAVLPSVLIGDRVPKAYVGRSLGVLLTMGSLVQLGVAPAVGFLLDVRGYEFVGIAMAVLLGLAGVIGWRVVGDLPWKRRAPDSSSDR
ncbi:MAG: MFS transporter [Chloroflexi bacterium]|nr:MFS transporter [Chloroflexota bacterium]